MKKIIFISMMLFVAGFAFSQNQTARNVTDQEGIKAQIPAPGYGQVQVPEQKPISPDDDDIKAMMQKNEDYYQDFQSKFKNLKTYNGNKQQRDELKAMQALIDRQKKLVDLKMEEVQIMERAGKSVSLTELTQLKDYVNRYHLMVVDLNNWVNKTGK